MNLGSTKETIANFVANSKRYVANCFRHLYWGLRGILVKLQTIKSNILFSVLAIVISLITMYFQFFNVKRELLYAYLSPKIEKDIHTLVIPVVYKNNGNQNEVILGSNVEMEIKTPPGEENYFRRIGDENSNLFPIILAPGEMKTINLKGEYKGYFAGMLEFNEYGLKYRRIDSLNNLSLKLTTTFLQNKGIENVEREIGRISFRNVDEYERLDYRPIELVELKSNNNITIVSNSIVNAGYEDSFSFEDSLSADQIEYIKFLVNHIDNPEIVERLRGLLDEKHIEY